MKLRILSYNIHKGFDRFGLSFVLHELKKALRSEDWDIVFLQEVVGENHDFRKKIPQWPNQSQFEFLADEVWPHFSYGKNAAFDTRNHGNAILCKFPLLNSENLNISFSRWQKRGLLHCVTEVPGIANPLHLFNTHLDLFARERHEQFEAIVQRIHQEVPPNEPLLLAGDFNDWEESLSANFEKALDIKEAHQRLHQKHAATFPNFFPLLRLDRLYYKNLMCHSCGVLKGRPWSMLSDHLPIWGEFQVELRDG
jgi:endonuclease/exonuclease/phosphatase family metal-dependent hydrolase